VLEVVNSKEYRGLSPKQIVPRLADEGVYLASESTVYRILRSEAQLTHRTPARSPTPRPKPSNTATGPNQLWSWDITYLKSTVRGRFFYLYLMVDVWSRKIVGWAVHKRESAQHASELVWQICQDSKLDSRGIVLHSDNGSPMRGATMLATLQWLGVVPSFSRPHVKDDNAYSESLFRTLKYRPSYPSRPFASVEAARDWVGSFVRWYNHEHRHSAIRYVTPAQRHDQHEAEILAKRERVYERAKRRRPSRWTGRTRNWTPVNAVFLNPPTPLAEIGVA
jgi:transposase InsO family protein